MFPFSTFFSSFSPFFLRNKRDQLSLGRGMGYYFSVWGIVTLLIILISVIAGWIFVTPERVVQWSGEIPEFSVTTQDGILTETGLPTDPYTLIDEKEFMIFVSKTLTEIPTEQQGRQGVFILRDRAIVSQAEQVGQKIQVITYSEVPELKNAHFDKAVLSKGIISELSTIKRIAGTIIAFVIFFISIMVAIWYCAWSFFWGLIVWLLSRTQKSSFTYEQAVGFVLSVFFPVFLVSLGLLFLEISFPFSMTLLFLLMLGYNHLSFYREQRAQKP